MTLVVLIRFCFRIIVSEVLIFQVHSTFNEPLTATLDEKPKLTSKMYVVMTNYFRRTAWYLFQKIVSKKPILEIFFTLKKVQVITFTEMRAFTLRNYVVKKDLEVLKLSKKINYFDHIPSVFIQNNSPKNESFLDFSSLKEPLVAIFSELSAVTFSKYVSEQDINLPKS